MDGATSKVGSKGGAGVVFRNHEGAFLGGACHVLPGCPDPTASELHACRRVVQLADEFNANRLHIETDSKEIASKLQNREKDLSVLGPLVEEVKMMLQAREQWKITWVRRSANGAAHALAREGVSNDLCKVWLHQPPDCILHILSAEIPAFYE